MGERSLKLRFLNDTLQKYACIDTEAGDFPPWTPPVISPWRFPLVISPLVIFPGQVKCREGLVGLV